MPEALEMEMCSTPSHVTRLPAERTVDNETVVARALDGDSWAKEAIYVRNVHKVAGIVAKLLRNSSDIEDVLQDTFIQVFRDLHQLRDPGHLGRWIASIAVHKVHRRFRRRKLARLIGLDRSIDDERLALQVRQNASQEARAELALLDGAFDRMSISQRTCWTLRYLEGQQLRDVATIAGCSLATAKRRIASAQAIIVRHFQEDNHG